jgi:hypothetical protein
MGACGDSPVLLVNNKHMCIRMSTDRIDGLLDDLKQAAMEEKVTQSAHTAHPADTAHSGKGV